MSRLAHSILDLRPPGGFGLIMADPPWQSVMWSDKGLKKSPEAHYPTMSAEDIGWLPVEALAAPDAVLWLWARSALLPDAMHVCAAWGFTFTTLGTWVKLTPHGKVALGLGYCLRDCGEVFLIGKRGKPRQAHVPRSVLFGERREHSRKPEVAYREAWAMLPDAHKLDLFSRQGRPGWVAWGNEAGKFWSVA